MKYVYNDNAKKLLFKNLRLKTLCKMWLPSTEEHNENLEDDLVVRCMVDGKRSTKVDRRADSESISFKNKKQKEEPNSMPYC